VETHQSRCHPSPRLWCHAALTPADLPMLKPNPQKPAPTQLAIADTPTKKPCFNASVQSTPHRLGKSVWRSRDFSGALATGDRKCKIFVELLFLFATFFGSRGYLAHGCDAGLMVIKETQTNFDQRRDKEKTEAKSKRNSVRTGQKTGRGKD